MFDGVKGSPICIRPEARTSFLSLWYAHLELVPAYGLGFHDHFGRKGRLHILSMAEYYSARCPSDAEPLGLEKYQLAN